MLWCRFSKLSIAKQESSLSLLSSSVCKIESEAGKILELSRSPTRGFFLPDFLSALFLLLFVICLD